MIARINDPLYQQQDDGKNPNTPNNRKVSPLKWRCDDHATLLLASESDLNCGGPHDTMTTNINSPCVAGQKIKRRLSVLGHGQNAKEPGL